MWLLTPFLISYRLGRYLGLVGSGLFLATDERFLPTPTNTMPNFYVTDSKGQRHLLTPQQLKALAEKGKITPDTPLETDIGQKCKAGQLKGLFTATTVSQVAKPAITTPSPKQSMDDMAAGWLDEHAPSPISQMKSSAQSSASGFAHSSFSPDRESKPRQQQRITPEQQWSGYNEVRQSQGIFPDIIWATKLVLSERIWVSSGRSTKTICMNDTPMKRLVA